ncbi:hypothetical protein C8R45DRAFT_1076052 [Mycena sanguinolenta]|nr:hypothetical protein C8R45DRAFT_1076052 [Mycena sanguinolenta]
MLDTLNTIAQRFFLRWTGRKFSGHSTVSVLSDEDLVHYQKAPVPAGSLRSHFLPALCITLHAALVVIHIVMLIGTVKHWEHRFTFSLASQSAVSFWSAVGTQSFGTVYCAILVFLTQKLAMRSLTCDKTSTAIHDNISSWTGLGSAFATLVNQTSAPASVFGAFLIAGYLGCISVLHISIPSILSVETFNTTVPVPSPTIGMLEYANSTAINSTDAYIHTFPTSFLPWRAIFDDSQTLGLFNSSLYEVLASTTITIGEAQVAALGFNISCGYLPADITRVYPEDAALEFTINGVPEHIDSLLPNFLEASSSSDSSNSITIFTTATVMDSQGDVGFPIIFEQQPSAILKNLTKLNVNCSQIQFLRCSKSLVDQVGMINSQSNTVSENSLYPSLHKNHSTWVPGAGLDFVPQDSTILGSALWSDAIGGSYNLGTDLLDLRNVDEYLMSYLGLDPFTNMSSVVLQLHEIENAVANLVAMVFWTAGHIKLDSWYIEYSDTDTGAVETGTLPVLVSGNPTIIEEQVSYARLNSNSLAVAFGLATSVIQLMLTIIFLRTSMKHGSGLQGKGLLHNIWLWRNHHQISSPLNDVRQPIERNLRSAGLFPLKNSAKEHADESQWWEEVSPDHSSSSFVPAILVSLSRVQSCIIPHFLLVLIHITALVIARTRKEHSIIFSADDQQTVSFRCKVATTAFGTIYYTLLVYLTQKLAIIAMIQKHCLLTGTHDKVSAWSDIGSAVSTLYEKLKFPASSLEISFIFLYLAAVSVLNITTPALLSAESFLLSVSTAVQTQGLPTANTTNGATLAFFQNTGSFLPWIDNLDQDKKLGLANESLYDVLEQTIIGSSGPTEISATGFNITCGYIPDVIMEEFWPGMDSDLYNVIFPAENLSWLGWGNAPDPNTILLATNIDGDLPGDSIILFTQNPVYDSSNAQSGFRVPVPESDATLQFIRCYKSLVFQVGQVDAGSRLLVPDSLSPPIKKTSSGWQAYDVIRKMVAIQDNPSMLGEDYWTSILSGFGSGSSNIIVTSGSKSLNWGSVYLVQHLGLNPPDRVATTIPQSITVEPLCLHDIENAIAALVASTFWIGGHVRTSTLRIENLLESNEKINVPILLTGPNVTVSHEVLAARLDVRVPAITIGLAASILLLILVLLFSRDFGGSYPYLTSLGFLQIIWVFEHHPEIPDILEQVEDPTDDNLRAAGLVIVRLSDAASIQPWESAVMG